MAPAVCPNCGAEVPPRARACPECGSCEETGWSASASTSGLGLPDEEFDYESFVEEEFGAKTVKPRGVAWFWWVVGLVVLVVVAIGLAAGLLIP
jgi:hypothetical protein